MIKHYIIYEDDGRIASTGKCPALYFEAQLEGHVDKKIIEGQADPDEHYILDEKVVLKSNLDTTNTVNGLTVTFHALPVGSLVFVQSQSVTVDQGGLVLGFEVPGVYKVRVEPPVEYKAEVLEVTIG